MFNSSLARRRCLRAGFYSCAKSGRRQRRNRRANEYAFSLAYADANSHAHADAFPHARPAG